VALSIDQSSVVSVTPQAQMLMLYNAERRDRGPGTLQLDSALMSQNDLNHSREMAHYNYFAHLSPINRAGSTFNRLTVNPAIKGHWSNMGRTSPPGMRPQPCTITYTEMRVIAGPVAGTFLGGVAPASDNRTGSAWGPVAVAASSEHTTPVIFCREQVGVNMHRPRQPILPPPVRPSDAVLAYDRLVVGVRASPLGTEAKWGYGSALPWNAIPHGVSRTVALGDMVEMLSLVSLIGFGLLAFWAARKLPVSYSLYVVPYLALLLYPRRVFFAPDEHVALYAGAVSLLYSACNVLGAASVACRRCARD